MKAKREDLSIRPFRAADKRAVIAVWRSCGLVHPANDPGRDIARKLGCQPELFLVGTLGGRVVATAMAGYEGHRGWVYYLGVLPRFQRMGHGRRLLAEAERLLATKGCAKVNLMVRTTNLKVAAFYRGLGYEDSRVILLGKRLDADATAGASRRRRRAASGGRRAPEARRHT